MKNIAAAVDFGTSKIVTLLAESGGFSRCDIIGSGTVPYDGYMDGHWNSPDMLVQAMRSAISAAELEGKTHIREVYVGVPCEYIRVLTAEAEVNITSPDGRASDDDVNLVQDAAADQLQLVDQVGVVIHRSPAWFRLDGGKKTMSPVGLRGSVLQAKVAFILADPAFIDQANQLFAELGLTVMGFLSPSMGESLLLVPLEDRDRAAVLIDVGYLNTEFSVVEGDAIVYHAVLPMGGGHITADLATDLEISMRAAEQIKREYIFIPDEFDPAGDPEVLDDEGHRLSFPRAFVQKSVEQSAGELARMIDLALKEAASLLGPRSQVFVTGGGLAMMRGGREYLAEKLGRPVKIPMAKAAKLNSPVYASALGLVDLVFDSIEQRTAQEESLPGRLAGGLRGLLGKKG
jgi:cell division protein FtsA